MYPSFCNGTGSSVRHPAAKSNNQKKEENESRVFGSLRCSNV